MEADWEIELGGESPLIEAQGPGFVDLRLHPERASQLPEAAALPALARALEVLNSETSQVWTSKCDVWTVLGSPDSDPADLDPYELDAPPGCAAHAIGGYIDLLTRNQRKWNLPATAADACKYLCSLLHAIPLRCCRVDLVVRQAILNSPSAAAASMHLGITAYFTACGPSYADATETFQSALAEFARVLSAQSTLE
jgi:hypothetical protein